MDKYLTEKKMSAFSKMKSYEKDPFSLQVPAPIDLNKEYGLLSYYGDYHNNRVNNLYNFLSGSLESGQWAYLDLEAVQININEHFKYLLLRKRYTSLFIESKSILNYDSSGFHINEHTFETLDEVKRALDNKMFL